MSGRTTTRGRAAEAGAAPGPIYYLSLGDSLAVGVQPTGGAERGFRTNDGYADQLGAIASRRFSGLETVKLGYPGESTTTMVEGGLTSYPRGSQLDEAVYFLRSHRGRVAFVTIDIGFNDMPSFDLESIPVGLASIDRNLPGILGRLTEAAGTTPIVGMTAYDPFLPHWLEGPAGQALALVSVWDAIVPINAHFVDLYRRAGLRVADVEGAFSTTDFDTQVGMAGVGPVPLNVARACEWTWGGTPPPIGPDLHATAGGYRAIAEAFAKVLLD